MTALLDHHLRDAIPSVRDVRPDLPAALDGAIGRATAKDAKDRFSDALELAAAFRAALEGDASSVTVPAGEIRNPYKGLRAFLEADAADFFGRETRHEPTAPTARGGREPARGSSPSSDHRVRGSPRWSAPVSCRRSVAARSPAPSAGT